MRRVASALAATGICAALIGSLSCGSRPPTGPSPGGNGGGPNQQPPANNLPVIDSITVQGSRAKQPANFADIGDVIDVRAVVHDDETAADQLQYDWSATTGGFSGTGAAVKWTAPASIPSEGPIDVVITLKVTEKYGAPGAAPTFQHDASKTATLSLHDSVDEVGDMARQFLIDFSDTDNKNADNIMRNFGRQCPDPSTVASERSDVINHFTNYKTVSFRIGTPIVTVNFGGTCVITAVRRRAGDACAIVRSYWDAIDVRDGSRGAVDGNDYLAASYSSADKRWWLCSSDYQGRSVSGATLRGFLTW